jgi:long-chain acyl-CoA synthetase
MKKGVRISYRDGKRIAEGLGCYEPKVVNDLKELVKGSARNYGSKPAFKFKNKAGEITHKTYIDLDTEIDCLGTALYSLGLKDTRMSIIGENRYEWGVCYLSVVNGTGVAVPLDRHLPVNEIENLINRGRVEVLFYSPAYHEAMLEIAGRNDKVKTFICMEEISKPTVESSGVRFLALPALIEKGRKLLAEGDKSFTEATIDREKMSVLLFTSGTTSMSKGVMLSHTNLASNITGVTSLIKVYPTDVHLSLLPLHHTFENTIGLLFMVHSGICIAYCDGIKYIAQNLKEYNVTLLVAVPAIFESMYRKLQEAIRKSGKEKLLKALIRVSDLLRMVGIDLRRQLFRSVFEQLGPGLRLAVSGAAALDKEVVTGFDKIGFRLLQGYGLTEASPVVAANNDFINVPGTIGYPMQGIDVAIDAPDENGIGEIITRGRNIMLGYYEDPAATADSFTPDGWLRTGDIGTIDEKGLIRITGRAKSMIVLTSGKKAFPEEYEVQLNNIPGIKDSYVWGNTAPDGDVQICAKLVVDREKAVEENGGLLPEKELAARFDAAIRELNKTMPQYKIIRYFVMTEEELIKANGIKTKRHAEYEKVKAMLEKAGVDIRRVNGRYIERLGNPA